MVHPDRAKHIKKLILRPNEIISSMYSAWFDAEGQISEDMIKLAPMLTGLETFIWDGVEPPEEMLWVALRKHCPRLCYIGSTVGGLPLMEDSELFNFSDLKGFSLVVNCRTRLFLNHDSVHKFPDALWNMLLYRCSDLQELTLGGERTTYYSPLFDIRPIVRGRWPKLHTLIFGHTLMQDSSPTTLDWDDMAQEESTKEFSRFISCHPLLKKLHIPYDARFPSLEILNSDVVITEFSGTHFYLSYVLPFSRLTTLRLCSERLQTWRLVDLLPCLRTLHSLSILELWIDMSHRVRASTLRGLTPEKNAAVLETNHIRVFRPLLTACDTLLHLKLVCTTKRKFAFRMKDFWKAIEKGPRLRSLEVQKVYTFNEEKMARSALQIARRVPTLQAITLVYADQHWSGLTPIRIKQKGVYDVCTVSENNFLRLTAEESGKAAQIEIPGPVMTSSSLTRSQISPLSITFLGTASAQPSSTRNHSSLALHLGRDVWLFDCGEATQHQIQKSAVKMGRIEKIFITHTHGVTLLPGCNLHVGVQETIFLVLFRYWQAVSMVLEVLLMVRKIRDLKSIWSNQLVLYVSLISEMLTYTETKPIEIYGPLGTRAYIRNGMTYTHTLLGSPYVVHELRMPSDPQTGDHTSLTRLSCELPSGRNISQVDDVWKDIFKDGIVSVSAAPIHHSVPCVGYVVTEAPVPGKIDPKLYIPDLKRTNTPMSAMRRLQQGESVELSDGTVLQGPPRRKGRKVVILGDTFDPSPIIPLAMDADLLVHEATNAHLPGIDPATKDTDTYESVEARAKSRGHSTPQMAGAFAKRVNARRLILNHFSARYSGAETQEAVEIMNAIGKLAAQEFGREVECAKDLMSSEVK
ncbi:hypothetical protein C0995_005508 [Termitomyces sp. Mi166|nr:hypothetical protein C0995_005508 [Termitomyces sp. Mi166\